VHRVSALHNTSVDAAGSDLASGAIAQVGVGLAVPSVGDRDAAAVITADHTAAGSSSAASSDGNTAISGATAPGNAGTIAVGAAGEATIAARAHAALGLSVPSAEDFEASALCACDSAASSSVSGASSAWDEGRRGKSGRANSWELGFGDHLLLLRRSWAGKRNTGSHSKSALHNTSVDATGAHLAAGAIGVIGVGQSVPSVWHRDSAAVLACNHTATGTAGTAGGDGDTAIVGAHVRGDVCAAGAVGSGTASKIAVATGTDATVSLAGPTGEHFEGSSLSACDVTATKSVSRASSSRGVWCRDVGLSWELSVAFSSYIEK
jgi:hypothetical protein